MKAKFLFAALFLIFLILGSTFVEMANAKSVFCEHKCKARCSKAKLKGRCQKNCYLCCEKCKCVPSYGSKHQCPCYRDIRNSMGKSKCP